MDLHVLWEVRNHTTEDDAGRGERRDHIGEGEVREVEAEQVAEATCVEASLMFVHLGFGWLVSLPETNQVERKR